MKMTRKKGPKPMAMDANYKLRLRRATQGKVCPSFKKLALQFNCSNKTIKGRLESIGVSRKKRNTLREVSKMQSHNGIESSDLTLH